MKITTFYATESGESRFGDVSIPLDIEREDDFGHQLMVSAPYASPAVQLVQLPAGLDQDFHNAPARQLVVVLSGRVEVETTDGACRQWQPGEIFMPADVTGRGHRTRTLGGPALVLFAPVPDDFEIGR